MNHQRRGAGFFVLSYVHRWMTQYQSASNVPATAAQRKNRHKLHRCGRCCSGDRSCLWSDIRDAIREGKRAVLVHECCGLTVDILITDLRNIS